MFTNPEVTKVSFVSENIAWEGMKPEEGYSSCDDEG